ncbi:MAG: DUF975 family protein [Turicibacter sp.]
MWTRDLLKEAGKKNFKRVYKQAVIVCLIVSIVGILFDGTNNTGINDSNDYVVVYENGDSFYVNPSSGEIVGSNGEMYVEESDSLTLTTNGLTSILFEKTFNTLNKSAVSFSISVILLISLSVLIMTMLVRMFILYPIVIGKNRFFMGIREQDRKVLDVFFLFDKSKIINPCVTMFLVDLFTFLWTLLLIVPGIIKAYEYSMIPYILSENSDMQRSRAFELSKEMMKGQKWNVFVLDLSFLGWEILSILTLGILGVFYVNPYRESTMAELYGLLREDALLCQYTNRNELPGFNI